MLLNVQQSIAREAEVPLGCQLDSGILVPAEWQALALIRGDPLIVAIRLPLLQMACCVVAPYRGTPKGIKVKGYNQQDVSVYGGGKQKIPGAAVQVCVVMLSHWSDSDHQQCRMMCSADWWHLLEPKPQTGVDSVSFRAESVF